MSPSTFNWLVLVLAIGVGTSSGIGARWARGRRDHDGWAVLAALATGVVASFIATIAVLLVAGVDAFAFAHLVYLVGAIGVPITAIIVLSGWRTASRWFRVLAVASLLPVPLGIYATHVEPFRLRTDTVTIALDAMTGDPIRVAVLADLQTTGIGDYERGALDRLLSTEPDIVLIPGDFYQFESVDDFERGIPEFGEVLARLSDEVDHVVAVNGNSDTVAALRQMAEGTDVTVLDNDVLDVDVDGRAVRILGVTLGGDEQRLDRSTEQFEQTGGDGTSPVRIVLAHQPDEVYRFESGPTPDLLVAGHTHGGQIAVPFIGPLVTLSSVPRSVAAGGLGDVDGVRVYVSTGVGRERGYAPQIRLGVRPSIGVIELTAP